jgi:hypothetical protein
MKLDKITKDRIDDYFKNISAEELLEKSSSFPIVNDVDSIITLESLKYDLLVNHEIFININNKIIIFYC